MVEMVNSASRNLCAFGERLPPSALVLRLKRTLAPKCSCFALVRGSIAQNRVFDKDYVISKSPKVEKKVEQIGLVFLKDPSPIFSNFLKILVPQENSYFLITHGKLHS